jgi:excisionase family DNA binding protein
MSTRFITRKEVAERYGVVVMTIDNWAADPNLGFPRSIRIGRNRCFEASELDAWDRQCAERRQFKSRRQAEAVAERAVAF